MEYDLLKVRWWSLLLEALVHLDAECHLDHHAGQVSRSCV